MNISSLKLYCDIVRLRNFSGAAKENGITQSMASQTVNNLETQLGALLIDRSQRPWKLTSEGDVLYSGAMDIIERYAELERQVKSRHDAARTTVRVASIYSAGLRHLNHYIHRFAQLYPWIQIKIEFLHPDQVYQRIQDDLVDLGIVSFPRSQRDIDVTPWHNEEIVVVCQPGHPLAGKKTITPAQLNDQPFIAFDRALDIRKEIDRYLKRHSISVDITFEFDNIEVIKQAVEIGSGISLLPLPTLDKEIQLKTLKAIPLTNERFVRPLSIIHRHGRKLNESLSQFISHLQTNRKSDI